MEIELNKLLAHVEKLTIYFFLCVYFKPTEAENLQKHLSF